MELSQKPNYELKYFIRCREDSWSNTHRFNASDDAEAARMAISFVENLNTANEEERKSGKREWRDWTEYKALGLERIKYVIKEVEEKTHVPLKTGVAARLGRGEPVELTELV
jgi:hypothetical protein